MGSIRYWLAFASDSMSLTNWVILSFFDLTWTFRLFISVIWSMYLVLSLWYRCWSFWYWAVRASCFWSFDKVAVNFWERPVFSSFIFWRASSKAFWVGTGLELSLASGLWIYAGDMRREFSKLLSPAALWPFFRELHSELCEFSSWLSSSAICVRDYFS